MNRTINEYLVMFLTFLGGMLGGMILSMKKDADDFGLNKRTLIRIFTSGFTGFIIGCLWEYYMETSGVMILCVISSLAGYLGPKILEGMGSIFLDSLRAKLNSTAKGEKHEED